MKAFFASFAAVFVSLSILVSASAQTTHAIGAGAVVIDNGSGQTITIQTPASGWTGNIPFVLPIPPTGNPPSGFVHLGTAANQILEWNPTDGVQGAWDATTIASLGGITGTGTNGYLSIWTGTSTQGNSNFIEAFLNSGAIYTSSDAAASLAAADATATNISVALTPKGSGALEAQIADGAATGGNARGPNAVDWQMARGAATEVASGGYATVGGGSSNTASGIGAFVGGGGYDGTSTQGNTASGNASVVGGGLHNTASYPYATVGGGVGNAASGDEGTVGGGGGNTASGAQATVAGGLGNTASRIYATVCGGNHNTASGQYSTAGGGYGNTASGQYATAGGGYGNTASGDYSAIPGGEQLTLSGYDDFGFLANNNGTGSAMTISANQTSVFGNSNLWLANNDNTARALYFYAPYNTAGAFGPSVDNYVGFKAGAVTTSVIWTLPLADGTSGQVLQTDGAGNLSWATVSGGGLTDFTESVNTTAPNATVPVVQLLATNAATNVDVALTPKGTGALTAQVADNTATGGNKRGANAVDWQTSRGAASDVASGSTATVSGGQSNTASNSDATVSGGASNTASNYYATVSGGYSNTASGTAATVSGGFSNTASTYYATVSGGSSNTASGIGAFVGGGGYDGTSTQGNTASGNASVVGGGLHNTASYQYATVGGGVGNAASGDEGTVGGGGYNTASGTRATIGGGGSNTASYYYATVGGGASNTASADYTTISGGYSNTASGAYSAVSGGASNTASGYYTTISGGYSNTASNYEATVSGGASNTASGTAATVSGGYSNTASGDYSAIPGGEYLTLSGHDDFGFLGRNDGAVPGNPMSIAANNAAVFGNTNLWLASNDGVAHGLYLFAPGSSNGAFDSVTNKFVAFKAGAVTTSVTYTLPTAAPTANGQVLSSTTGGVMSWATAGGSSGLAAFGYVYTLDAVAQTVAGGADVTFSNNGPLSNETHTAGTSTITVGLAGNYEINYNISTTAGVGAAIAIAVNGTVDGSTPISVLSATGETSGSAIVTLAAGDVITLRNNSATPLSLTAAPAVGSQITVKKLD